MKKLILIWFIFLPFLHQSQEIPPLNKKVIEFCDKSMGKKVDRGECWDLAKNALDFAKASWDYPFAFGTPIDPLKDSVFPGDIIQFERVKLSDGAYYPQHTAIIYEVIGKGNYIIAHQNFNGIRKVTKKELNINLITKGNIDFYRPKN